MFPNLFPAGALCPLRGVYWHRSRDGDDEARSLFDRHYSRIRYKDGRKPKLFVGPGQKEVLITADGKAMFVWRKFIDGSGQQGVNCAVFRNEGPILSSLLILEAEEIAWARWPGARLYTYVNPKGIKSSNPGACFKHAGWTPCGTTKVNKLIILEKHVPIIHTGELGESLRDAWCAETSSAKAWSPENPTEGQCAVTALVVQDALGGSIVRVEYTDTGLSGSHYFNRLPNGADLDLTCGQFTAPIFRNRQWRSREYLLSNEDTRRRYEILLALVAQRRGEQRS